MQTVQLQLAGATFHRVWCAGFSLQWFLLLQSRGSVVVAHGLRSCGSWASLLLLMGDLPRPGIKPMSVAIGRQMLNHWEMREVPTVDFLNQIPLLSHQEHITNWIPPSMVFSLSVEVVHLCPAPRTPICVSPSPLRRHWRTLSGYNHIAAFLQGGWLHPFFLLKLTDGEDGGCLHSCPGGGTENGFLLVSHRDSVKQPACKVF